MTTDVRTLLHDAADAPSRAPDIDGALRSAARIGVAVSAVLGGLAAVVAIALVVGLVALGSGGGDDAQIAVGLRQSGSQIPDGWKTVTADPGITLSVPGDWSEMPPSGTPIGTTVLNLFDDLADQSVSDVLGECTTGRAAEHTVRDLPALD